VAQILIVEDDLDLSEMLQSYFRSAGYEIFTAAWGKDALKLSWEHHPDLVILDIRLPDMDGFEVCRQLRNNRRTQDISIIFLTERRERENKLTGLSLGAVDYITKPFDIQELHMRVGNNLRRKPQQPVNPVTNLPDWPLVEEKLNDLLQSGESWALLTVAIDGLDDFGSDYGFVAAEDVLRALAQMIKEAENPTDFVGHLGANAFVIVTDNLPALREQLEFTLKQHVEDLYGLTDRDEAQRAIQANRLRPMIGQVLSEDGPFENLDALGSAINYEYLW
jgi:PleD family two-component response regulator